MRQRKENCWYFGGNWLLDFALRIEIAELRLFLAQRHFVTSLVILSTRTNKILGANVQQ